MKRKRVWGNFCSQKFPQTPSKNFKLEKYAALLTPSQSACWAHRKQAARKLFLHPLFLYRPLIKKALP